MAQMIFSLIHQMFRFVVERDLIEHDPIASILKAKIAGKDVERDRIFSEDEIQIPTEKIPDARLTPTTEAAVWSALSSCGQIGERINAR